MTRDRKTMATGAAAPAAAPVRSPLWQALCHWHYAAGLILLPFFILLAVTGPIYLFKPQLEPWLYRAQWTVAPQGPAKPASVLEQAALTALPGSQAQAYREPMHADDAAQFTLKDKDGRRQRVWVDPYDAHVTGWTPEDGMFMQRIRDLHGEVLLGPKGGVIMDLVAGWGLVLLLCGVGLWWPRRWSQPGALKPRLKAPGRTFWRDLHAVPAAWGFVAIFGFLLTGLPWTAVTGKRIDALAAFTHSGSPPMGFGPSPLKIEAHAPDAQPVGLDAVVAVSHERLPGAQPWILYPKRPDTAWVIQYQPDLPTQRAYIHVDPYSGKVLGDFRWKEHGAIGKLTAISVSLHQGTLFGRWNYLLNLCTAALVLLVSGTGLWMWWRRRPPGTLGLPAYPVGWVWPAWLRWLVLALGLAMPAFGVSVLLLWAAFGSPSGSAKA